MSRLTKKQFPVVEATVDDSWQLTWWILSQGNSIEVIKPESLRKNIINEIRHSLEQYDNVVVQ